MTVGLICYVPCAFAFSQMKFAFSFVTEALNAVRALGAMFRIQHRRPQVVTDEYDIPGHWIGISEIVIRSVESGTCAQDEYSWMII